MQAGEADTLLGSHGNCVPNTELAHLISTVSIGLELQQALDHVRVAIAGCNMQHALAPLHVTHHSLGRAPCMDFMPKLCSDCEQQSVCMACPLDVNSLTVPHVQAYVYRCVQATLRSLWVQRLP